MDKRGGGGGGGGGGGAFDNKEQQEEEEEEEEEEKEEEEEEEKEEGEEKRRRGREKGRRRLENRNQKGPVRPRDQQALPEGAAARLGGAGGTSRFWVGRDGLRPAAHSVKPLDSVLVWEPPR
ncbi:hypothetical protein EYF80_031981 [Liparis tanakae]|uniref:Uncharacterized protein n=1 Tax=Liparis tanakae TaxID=230148 RepID=A0A4Z2GVX1_9TELE|nr:hypothetical protein EYF80_031981 [Liparis tanakae]